MSASIDPGSPTRQWKTVIPEKSIDLGMTMMNALPAFLKEPMLAALTQSGKTGFQSSRVDFVLDVRIGKASVYKYIPNYFPNDVGAVGGMVGLLGALGGFILPPVFGALGRWTGTPQMAFVALLLLTGGSPHRRRYPRSMLVAGRAIRYSEA